MLLTPNSPRYLNFISMFQVLHRQYFTSTSTNFIVPRVRALGLTSLCLLYAHTCTCMCPSEDSTACTGKCNSSYTSLRNALSIYQHASSSPSFWPTNTQLPLPFAEVQYAFLLISHSALETPPPAQRKYRPSHYTWFTPVHSSINLTGNTKEVA
jgi:hypothetical protein